MLYWKMIDLSNTEKRVRALNNGDETKLTQTFKILTNKQNREIIETVLTATDETEQKHFCSSSNFNRTVVFSFTF